MTDQERDECRDVQDRLLTIARRKGMTGRDVVWSAPRLTVNDLDECIYPKLLPEFRRILSEYQLKGNR